MGSIAMATTLKPRNLDINVAVDASVVFGQSTYDREVLQLEDVTEDTFDINLAREAAALGIEVPSEPVKSGHNVQTSLCESADTTISRHARSGSSGSQGSSSTELTSDDEGTANGGSPMPRMRSGRSTRSQSFGEYDRYLAHFMKSKDGVAHNYSHIKPPPEPAPSLFSVSTRRSFNSMKSTIKSRFKLRKNTASMANLNSCVCCRDDFKRNKALFTLSCQHKYCEKCLRVLIQQATSDESKMPPKCCSKGIPGSVVKSVLSHSEQQHFLKSVTQFSTPWSDRIFCPTPTCGAFIPPAKLNPKHPFEVVCQERNCRTRACSTCKRHAHPIGQDCPADWELDAVLKMGENAGWRRCYKCRTLVELTHGCSHITCRCKAQFCYICGAVWDPLVGCPNYCNGEEELERRRIEEAERAAEEAAEKQAREELAAANALQNAEADQRSRESSELNTLRARQINERDRFDGFERKMKWVLWTRHGQQKLAFLDKYSDLQLKMRERHLKTSSHLEDRQVAAEMELRATLKQSERSVQIRLKHMEAYCDGLGRNQQGANPARVVTERDLRELGQQYNLRDDIERLHQSRINVMREKQGKQMELLLGRHEDEIEKLAKKQEEELDAQELTFGQEEEKLVALFKERRQKLRKRWALAGEVERRKLEARTGVRYGKMLEVVWPEPVETNQALDSVGE